MVYAPGMSQNAMAPVTNNGFRQSNYDRALNKWSASDARFKALFDKTTIIPGANAKELLLSSGADFNPVLWKGGCQRPDGQFVPNGKFEVHREDNGRLLQTDVSGAYNMTPYMDLLLLPEDLEIPINDADTILASEALQATACCVWQDGKSAHIQYKLSEFDIEGDRYESYLTIVAYLDGTGSTKAFLTMTRVVCENTMAHAIQDFRKLAKTEQDKLSLRRHANMSSRLTVWRENIVAAMVNSTRFARTFEILHQTKLQNAERVMLNALSNLFGLEESLAGSGKGRTQAENRLDELVNGMRNGTGQTGKVPVTALELYNGLTFNLSWNQQFKGVKGWDASDMREKAMWKTLIDDAGEVQSQALQYVVNLAAAA